jgi:hypothetical protein
MRRQTHLFLKVVQQISLFLDAGFEVVLVFHGAMHPLKAERCLYISHYGNSFVERLSQAYVSKCLHCATSFQGRWF